jgi:sodium transport system permease protein
MHTLLTVFRKEFLENIRDRRTLFSALLFGPLLGPIVFGAMVSRILDQNTVESDQPLMLTLADAERAPGLEEYLRAQGVVLVIKALSEADAEAAVRKGDAEVVIVVPAEYPARFRAALPAPLLLVADSSDSQSRRTLARARAVLAAYAGSLAQERLQVRGVNPLITAAVAVNDVDVASAAGRSVALLGFVTYFMLFAVLMGGLYLAIDSTAGERERGSLEALLSLPVSRAALVGGKLLATCSFMCISLAISISAFVAVFRFVSLDRLGMSANLGPATGLIFFVICLPFVPLGAALMTFVASFTQSYREAQTYLSTVLLVPTLPIAFAGIYSLKTKTSLMFIPSLSQHLLMTSVLRDEPLGAGDLAISAASSLGLAALLIVLTARHWRREIMLG